MPGVNVEVSSAALIEKTRTALSDSAGQSRSWICRPVYQVAFTLAGFKTVRREGSRYRARLPRR
jgi:hypothetical protein